MWLFLGISAIIFTGFNLICSFKSKNEKWFRFGAISFTALTVWAIFIRKTHKPLFCCGHQPTASWELSSIYSAIRRNSSAYLNFTLMFPPS